MPDLLPTIVGKVWGIPQEGSISRKNAMHASINTCTEHFKGQYLQYIWSIDIHIKNVFAVHLEYDIHIKNMAMSYY